LQAGTLRHQDGDAVAARNERADEDQAPGRVTESPIVYGEKNPARHPGEFPASFDNT
jgi:hypothetical protein